MAQKKPGKVNYMSYPPHDAIRTGIKVSWYYYKDHEQAIRAAEAARHNAAIQQSLGYDFGYQCPGSQPAYMPKNNSFGPEYSGLWEVCIP